MIDGVRKSLGVHTAVARAFCEGYSPELQVNHKDGNKTNNAASNLEWMTPGDNTRHAREVLGFNNMNESNPNAKAVIGRDKVTGEIVYQFPCVMTAARHFSPTDEKRARCIQNVISRIALGCKGKKSYCGCVWSYE